MNISIWLRARAGARALGKDQGLGPGPVLSCSHLVRKQGTLGTHEGRLVQVEQHVRRVACRSIGRPGSGRPRCARCAAHGGHEAGEQVAPRANEVTNASGRSLLP
jgi:hypothetical protein